MLFHFLLVALLLPSLAQAEIKVITAEASYTMGDGESPTFAEAQVLQKAKQAALEQAGTYVEAYTKTHNYDLTTEEIQSLAGGVLSVEVLEKTRTLVGEGVRFYTKIKATVTTDKMEVLARRSKDKNVTEGYEKIQNEYDEYVKLKQAVETQRKIFDGTADVDEIIRKPVSECDSRPVSDACMTILYNAGFSRDEIMTWVNKKNQAVKAAAQKLLESYGCDAKSVTAVCLRNLKREDFTDYQVGEWLNEVDTQYPGQLRTAEWIRLKRVYREGPEGALRKYEREYKQKYGGLSQ
jgi:hypothetical protein